MRKCIFKSLNIFLPYNTPGPCLFFPGSFPWHKSNLFTAELRTLQSLGQMICGGVLGLQGQCFPVVQTVGCDVRKLRKKTEEKRKQPWNWLGLNSLSSWPLSNVRKFSSQHVLTKDVYHRNAWLCLIMALLFELFLPGDKDWAHKLWGVARQPYTRHFCWAWLS